MKFRYINYIVFLSIILPLKGIPEITQRPEIIQYYAQKYPVPPEIKERLDAASLAVPDRLGGFSIRKIGNLYVKRNIDRLQGMEIIRNAAQAHSYPHVIVPNQYIYIAAPNLFFVVTEEIAERDPQEFTKELIKEIYKVAKTTGYSDIREGNIIQTVDGKIAFIDTEMYGFRKEPLNTLEIKLSYLKKIQELPMDAEAKGYILRKINAKEDILYSSCQLVLL